MSASINTRSRSQLLDSLSERLWNLISPSLEALELPKDFLIASQGDHIDHVYFLESGIGSVISSTQAGLKAETACLAVRAFPPWL